MKKLIPLLAAAVFAFGFAIYFHFGGAIKTIIETAGTEALGTPVHVGSVSASLAARTASISSLSVSNPAGFTGNLLETKSISATLDGIEGKTVTIKEIVVDGMTLAYQFGPNGANFDALQKHLKSIPSSSPQEENANSSGYGVVIQQLRINNAKVIASLAGREQTLTLPEIVVNGIGSKDHPATPEQVAKQIMDHVLAISTGAATRLNLKSLNGLNADKVKSRLNGLFSH